MDQPPAQLQLTTRTLTSLDSGRHALENRYSAPRFEESKQSMAFPKIEVLNSGMDEKKRRQE